MTKIVLSCITVNALKQNVSTYHLHVYTMHSLA